MARNQLEVSDPHGFLAMLSGKSVQEFRNRQAIYAQGDKADAVFYLQKGKVKIAVTSKQGREAVIAIANPGDFFGEGSLVSGHPLRMASASSIGRSIVVRLQREAVVRLLHEESGFADLFMAHILARTIRVEEDLVDQLFNSAEKRLARALLLLSNFGKEQRPQSVIPKVSQETLAQMIGASRPRVNAFLNKFRKLGFIDYNGGLRVNASLLRVVLHD